MPSPVLLWIPALAQCVVVIAIMWGVPPGRLMYLQGTSVLISLVFGGTYFTRRVREQRRQYRELRRVRAEHEVEFRNLLNG